MSKPVSRPAPSHPDRPRPRGPLAGGPAQRARARVPRRAPLGAALVLLVGTAAAGAFEDARDTGPWGVAEGTLTLPNGDTAQVYAPRIPQELRSRYENAFPLVAILQGALVESGQYRNVARLLAAQGFGVIVPDHLRRFPGIPGLVRFSEVGVVTAAYDGAVLADADPASPLYLVVDTETMGLVGHSLGGFVAFYALAGICDPSICSEPGGDYRPPEALQALAVYGANLVDFDGSVIDLDTSRAPSALVQGSLDSIGTPAESAATYEVLEPPRALMTVHGANHYGICDDNNPLGATPDPVDPTLDQIEANRYIARWAGFWLRTYLKDDLRAWIWLYRIGGSFDGVVDVIAE